MTTGVFAGLWDVVSCSSKEKYICKKPAEGVQVTTVPPTTPPLSCESGWTPINSRNICFKVREPLRSSLQIWTSVSDVYFSFFNPTYRFTKSLPSSRKLGRKLWTSALPSAETYWAYTARRTCRTPGILVSQLVGVSCAFIQMSDQCFLLSYSFSSMASAWIGFSLSASKGFVWSDGSAVCSTLFLP